VRRGGQKREKTGTPTNMSLAQRKRRGGREEGARPKLGSCAAQFLRPTPGENDRQGLSRITIH